MSAPLGRPAVRVGNVVACVIAALMIVLAWSLYTQHAWEDFFISFRASRNLATGQGLVFQAGERLHTFTSPLHTLLLAGLSTLTGAGKDPVAVLWLYRLLGGAALGGTLALVYTLGRKHDWARPALLIAVGWVAVDAKSIDFTVAGMETPLLLFFLALHFHALVTGSGWRRLGVAWAGLMWSRPDAFIFILASLAAAFLFGGNQPGDRRALGLRILKAGALAAALYAPWLLWATYYYGSPIPNTVVAKGLDRHFSVGAVFQAPWEMLVHGGFLVRVYGATFVRLVEDWGAAFYWFWRLVALVAWLYWLVPRGSRAARLFSFSFFLASLYGATAPFASWYAPPYTLVATIAWGFIVNDLARLVSRDGAGVAAPRRRQLQVALAALAVGLVTVQATASLMMARTMRWQQALNETGNRRELGEWLEINAKPGDSVFLECVGYIGYFSGLKTYDFPGLTSTEVVAARRRLGTNDFGALIVELQPDWLVLRPGERDAVSRSQRGLLAPLNGEESPYELVRVFDRSREIAAIPHLPGRRYLQIDQRFEVYRRQTATPLKPVRARATP